MSAPDFLNIEKPPDWTADGLCAETDPEAFRTVARELGVTEYRAGRLLARTNNNGMGGTP